MRMVKYGLQMPVSYDKIMRESLDFTDAEALEMTRKWRIMLLTALALLLTCACAGSLAEIVISEIMTDNGVYDTNGNAYDWIELHNRGDKPVDISGWGLTDSKSDLYAFTFPSGTTLNAGEYALIYCCGDAQEVDRAKNKTYHAAYKLSNSGETIRLTDKNGNEVQAIKYPAQYPGFSWGLANGTEEYGFFVSATPRKKNAAQVFQAQAPRPVIDTPAGFYDEAVEVTVTCDDPVYYTVDGSEPTADSKLYTGPITVKKTGAVRVKAIPEDRLPSYTETSSYIISDPAVTPVICLSTDRDYLYGSKGLFKKPNYNTDWEYPIHMEYFDEDGVRQINQFGSFHIVGTSTRGQKQKSLAVYARTAYGGENRFHYNPFPDRDYEEYRTFNIRSTGSDSSACRMKDLVLTRLAAGLDIMYQAGKTVVVYINGEYSGQYNIREKINKYSVAQWEGITDKEVIDKIDIIEGEARDDQIQNGNVEEWRELRAFVKANDLTVPENLKYVTDRLDVDSLFTWASFELCIMNTDLENVRVYRVPGGKWKYILYDVEGGGGGNETAIYMLLDSSKAGGRLSSHYSLINRLLKVPEMRARFLTRLAEVIENSFLYSERVKPEIERSEELLKQLLPRHFSVYKVSNMGSWRTNVLAFKRSMRVAPKQVLKRVCECLNVTPEEQATYFKVIRERLDVTNAKGVE